MPELETLEPEKIDVTCDLCQSDEVFIIDFIAGCMFPLPDIFAIECRKCGYIGNGYQDSRGWHTEISKSVAS
jgi:hypothetical protein